MGAQSVSMEEVDWEAMWAPYDERSYQAVLANIKKEDTVLEIGAGDLRLAIRIAAIARKVYAIEIQKELLKQAEIGRGELFPYNLVVIEADARNLPFPSGITTAVLLMRHCRHFALYAAKLKASGCQRLITNARWRYEPEVVDLQARRMKYSHLELGWYACICGGTGFKPGPVERLSEEIEAHTFEVEDCPACRNIQALTDTPWQQLSHNFQVSHHSGSLGTPVIRPRFGGVSGRPPAHTPKSGTPPQQLLKSQHSDTSKENRIK